jgi:hypothetical protein
MRLFLLVFTVCITYNKSMQYYIPFVPFLRKELCGFLSSKWNVIKDILKVLEYFSNDFLAWNIS